MSLLLDTNVLSDIREKTPTPGVIAWFAGTRRGRSSSSWWLGQLIQAYEERTIL